MAVVLTNESVHFREVWNDNLDEEFALIRDVVDNYPYIAIDTEFPGTVHSPKGRCDTVAEKKFKKMKMNVDATKLIQLGFTFFDSTGNFPTCGTDKYCVWQFNFREFNPTYDTQAVSSIQLLRDSGINFYRNNSEGVNVKRFAELLMSSGVVVNRAVKFVAFDGKYDFGYLLKELTAQNLPETRVRFKEELKTYFPTIYDVQHMMRYTPYSARGLSNIADKLGVERIGTSHLAGSDSLLTARTFLRLRAIYFPGSIEHYSGVLSDLQ